MSYSLLNNAPYTVRVGHLALALALGLFVGMEREWRHKHAGLRTFGFAALLGGIGGVLGPAYGITSLVLVGLLVTVASAEALLQGRDVELTTSAALLVTTFAGILSGVGHTVTPTAVALTTAGLLAWKEELAGFTVGLTVAEVRSATLLAILAFVVYPLLPSHRVGPGGVLEPRLAWITVVLIAAIGFGNYVLLKIFGGRGLELTGFLGGLVNSTVTVTELAERTRAAPGLAGGAQRAVLLSVSAMAVRNAVVAGILAAAVLPAAAAPLSVLVLAPALLALRSGERVDDGVDLRLRSPFSLLAALKFGLVFLGLQVAGDFAQRYAGHAGFLAVSGVGGLISSASAVASAAALAAHHTLAPRLAGLGVSVASLASVVVDLPLVTRFSKDRPVTRRLLAQLVAILAVAALATGAAAVLTG